MKRPSKSAIFTLSAFLTVLLLGVRLSAIDNPTNEKDSPIRKNKVHRFTRPLLYEGKIIKSTLKDDQFVADCNYETKARGQHLILPFKLDKQSLLLRAERNGQFTKITINDLFKHEHAIFMWLAAFEFEEDDSKERTGRIFWFILYPEGVKSPPLPKRAISD